jgi:uncharacterized membrane protein
LLFLNFARKNFVLWVGLKTDSHSTARAIDVTVRTELAHTFARFLSTKSKQRQIVISGVPAEA